MQLKSIVTVLFVVTLSASNVHAQQIFKISEYDQHNYIYNPAAAGANDKPSVGVLYRKMWAGIDGGPQTVILFGDKYFESKKTGIGVVLYSDKTGPTKRVGGQFDLSYSVHLTNEKRLMFGLGGQVMQYSIDKTQLASSAYFDPTDKLMSSPSNITSGDASAGVYLNTPTYTVGFSIQQLIKSRLNFVKDNSFDAKEYRQYTFTGDYRWKTDEDNTIIPNAIVKYMYNAPIDLEAGARLEHKDILWIGFNYHYQQSYTAFAGVKINHQLAIGYAYDAYETPLSVFDNGGDANEVSIRYYFNK